MRGDSAVPDQRAAVECAFVAVRYALGVRQTFLLCGLSTPSPAACHLANALGQSERIRRASALAEGLKPVVEALDRMRFNCH